jgi:hypothetical protein
MAPDVELADEAALDVTIVRWERNPTVLPSPEGALGRV